jgi:hypothetical protein
MTLGEASNVASNSLGLAPIDVRPALNGPKSLPEWDLRFPKRRLRVSRTPWEAVCKTAIRRFDSGPRLSTFWFNESRFTRMP